MERAPTFDIYLSGPTVGVLDFNRLAFQKASRLARACGLACFSPVELEGFGSAPWKATTLLCVRALTYSRELVQLEGWESCAGSRLDYEIAKGLGLSITGWTMTAKHLEKIIELSGMDRYGAHLVL